MAIYNAITAEGRVVSSLIHDGLLVQRQPGDSGLLPTEVLRRWECAVEATTGFRVRLAEKPMEENPLYAVPGRVPLNSPARSLLQASASAPTSSIGGSLAPWSYG